MKVNGEDFYSAGILGLQLLDHLSFPADGTAQNHTEYHANNLEKRKQIRNQKSKACAFISMRTSCSSQPRGHIYSVFLHFTLPFPTPQSPQFIPRNPIHFST